MKFQKILNELKISALAYQLKRGNEVFNKSDDDIMDAIKSLTDDTGKIITDVNIANQYIKKLGLNPADPKISRIINMAVKANIQSQGIKASVDNMEAEKVQTKVARGNDLRNQISALGWSTK